MSFNRIARRLTYLLIGLLAGCSRNPVTPPIPPPSKNPPTQIRRLLPFFLGDVAEFHEEFEITNQSDSPIKFVNVVKSCTCSKAQLEKDVLVPGESTKLSVTVRPEQRTGKTSVVCGVVDTQGVKREYSILFTCLHRVTFSRPTLSYGRIKPGHEQALRFCVMAYGLDDSSPATMVDVLVDDSKLRAEPMGSELVHLDDGVSARQFFFNLILPQDKTADSGESIVRAAIKTGDAIHSAACPVNWVVSSPYTVTPSRIFVPALTRDGHFENMVTIRRTDLQPFRILSVSSSLRAVKAAHVADNEDQRESVAIALSGRDLAGEYTVGTITINTDAVDAVAPLLIPFSVRLVD